MIRLLSLALLTLTATAALADDIVVPKLRPSVTVAGDLVRIGDVVDNAGAAANIAIFRAPDLGTTGTLPVKQLLTALRAHQVIGIDTRDLQEIAVTRAARTLEAAEIERAVGAALQNKNGLGDAANLALTFDRAVQPLLLDAAGNGALQVQSVRYEPRTLRFDVTFATVSDTAAPAKLRLTGTAVETAEAAVLARAVERGEILKSSDVLTERRPKAELGTDGTSRDVALGMQARRPLRAGQALRSADLVKPDLVTRDMNVTLIYQTSGLYLTIRGKALDGGTDGDVVSVMNLQSKRVVSGVVSGRGQVTVTPAAPRPVAAAAVAAPISVASAAPRPAE